MWEVRGSMVRVWMDELASIRSVQMARGEERGAGGVKQCIAQSAETLRHCIDVLPNPDLGTAMVPERKAYLVGHTKIQWTCFTSKSHESKGCYRATSLNPIPFFHETYLQ